MPLVFTELVGRRGTSAALASVCLGIAGGRFCFSVALADAGAFVLKPSRRYAHSTQYVRALAQACRVDVIDVVDEVLRTDRGSGIVRAVLTLRA